MDRFIPTERATLKRLPNRAVFDRQAVYQILDESFICHVGFALDGNPLVIPTGYGRDGNNLYIHGSAANRTLNALERGVEVCVTVTLLDGLVLARSVFHHSMNYRSVMIFGKASVVEGEKEKLHALRVITEHIMPGRWAEAREPNGKELKQTKVLKVPLEEVSAKVRTGPPLDDEDDYALAVWAGELPLRLTALDLVPDPRLPAGTPIPDRGLYFSRGGSGE
jgi:nitroimidazol reductase NimA-like FMN-containing flavoprotein (pyridoxamine 5'-phosphate oxidase superfamily)